MMMSTGGGAVDGAATHCEPPLVSLASWFLYGFIAPYAWTRKNQPVNRLVENPVGAVRFSFFTRRSGRAETCGCFLPSTANGGLASAPPTRNPFMNLWVKALAWRTPQDRVRARGRGLCSPNAQIHYSRLPGSCQWKTGKFSRFGRFWKKGPPRFSQTGEHSSGAANSSRCSSGRTPSLSGSRL